MVVPCSLADANEFVLRHHRHHGRVQGHKFSLALADADGTVHAVAVVGRPVSRHMDDGWTLEVTRLASDGERNACSCLYRAAWRAARALGYRRIITYTLASEPGSSLRGAAWKQTAVSSGGSWSRENRPRVDRDLGPKLRWEAHT